MFTFYFLDMKKSIFLIFSVLLLAIGGKELNAQVVINEFMASNTSAVVDPDYNESSDWIELYNAGNTTVSLKGYGLTDNISDPAKWKITSDVQLNAKGYLLIWADGMNAGLHTNFKLSSIGEELALVKPDLTIADSIVFGPQEVNISYGRKQDGAAQWAYFNVATPGKTNSTEAFTGIVKSFPEFSIPGGIFHNSITLELKTLYGGVVHYTLDGSAPDQNSPVVSSPINITKNTVVRAVIYKAGQLLGPVATNSYFIDLNNELSDLPIISISSDPKNFWDPEIGIYVVHSSKPDWEIPINIELFEKDGRDRAAFNLPAGAKSTGLYSWQLPEKMLGISFRKEYGASKLEYPLIFDKDRKVYDTFSLRASGSDWEYTLFRDGMLQSAAVENTNIDNSGFRPAVVYINGEFMGIENIREKIDEDYIVGNYGLEPGTFDMIEEVDAGINVETGDEEANNLFLQLTSKDLTVQANYDAVADIVDIEDFTDVVCTEVYSGNSSIGHNLMKWKPKDSGKWKWILMDFDRCFFGTNKQMISFYVNETGWPFKALMKNEGYKEYFGRKLADLLFTTFNPDRMIPRIEAHKEAIDADIPRHVARWQGTHGTGNYSGVDAISSYDYWVNQVEVLKTYAQDRPGVLLNDLTNYGFQSPVAVSVITSPANAGTLTFNGLKIPVNNCMGGYPANEEITLVAEANAGYRFKGWASGQTPSLIAKESSWNYYDKGTDLGAAWKEVGFDDSGWSKGKAELGYGDGDENTVVESGSDSNNKYITTYFRKGFTITDKTAVTSLEMFLKVDDGAVVYLNGNEVHRSNLPTGAINYQTIANTAVGGTDESTFNSFSVDTKYLINGTNVVAVEVHQSSSSSSDLGFDLEALAEMTNGSNIISTNKELVVNTQSDVEVTAVFESNGKCILPSEITDVYTLSKACSPYVCSSDVNISSTGKLIVEPGVVVWMSDGASIYSEGAVVAKGTGVNPIRFIGNPERSNKNWGFISVSNAKDTSFFNNVIIEDASQGRRPREVAAITAYNTAINFDSIYFENILANPIATRFCDVTLTNSILKSNVVGDLINITRGKAYIANCEFIGNNLPDNDAIDFNGGSNSLIKNCIIRDFFGINSDAIDLGEEASGIVLDGLYVHDVTDKGVSIGQWSSASIINSLFTNCNMGAGVKDSSYVSIDHCTFYGVGTPVHTYEKVSGRAGGNVDVTNSIFSNSYEASYVCDEYSTIDIAYSASDNDRLPDNRHNIFGNPLFTNPTFFDFSLQPGSMCIDAGSSGNIGSGLTDTGIEPEVLISDIAYISDPNLEDLEFIGLYNPGDTRVDIGGYVFKSGITFTFPEGVSIGSNEKLYVTNNASSSFWLGRGANVYQWESGRLNDKGEDIQLTNDVTTMIDEVTYDNKAPWPIPSSTLQAISLSRFDVDNHFGENWEIKTIDSVVSAKSISDGSGGLIVYPNPTTGVVFFRGVDLNGKVVDIFNLSGNKVSSIKVNDGQSSINLAYLQNGMYLLQSEGITQRIILKK